jgi:hypothetical protein
MGPDKGESQTRGRGEADSEVDFRDTRSVVDWYFGDLVEHIAAEQPISEDQLLAALTWTELEGRCRHEEGESFGEMIRCPKAPGTVYRVPVETWRELEEAQELSEAEGHAVRAVHRRMVRSIVNIELADGTEPFVFCAEPREVRGNT